MVESLLPALLLLAASVVLPAVTARAARPDSRPSYAAGIRTRQTMASPEAWQAAHRAALPLARVSGMLGALFSGAAAIAATTTHHAWTTAGILCCAVALTGGAIGCAVVGNRAAVRAGR